VLLCQSSELGRSDEFLVPLTLVGLVTLLVLASEIGGVSLALQLATGIAFPWWAPAVALAVWLLLWKGTFGVIEYGVSLLGLVTIAFVVAAVRLRPEITELGRGLLPSLPQHEPAHYWYIAVSILGASITPYLFYYFYSSGAVEDGWNEGHLRLNRVVATLGTSFGGGLAAAVLVVAALVLAPRGIAIESCEQVALILTTSLGRAGFWLFVASLGIACFGAALEVTLAVAYMVAQGLGWNWGENVKPRHAARFCATYTVVVALAMLIVITGVDPLKLTLLAMALTAATLPVAVVPFLFLMNDPFYVREHCNGWIGNGVVLAIILLASVLAVVSIPLEIMGGS